MEKSMYSLMLSDSVVKAIDRLAGERGATRSGLVNHILAEYLQMKTPEMHIREIFSLMTEQLGSLAGFLVQSRPSDVTLAIRSPLDYKYRPTIKYSVEMYRAAGEAIGELRVVFRTQHSALLSRLAQFFDLWIGMETYYIHKLIKNASIRYTVEEGRFKRTLMQPVTEEAVTNDLLSRAIGGYVEMFDSILKQYLSDPLADAGAVERRYVACLQSGMIII